MKAIIGKHYSEIVIPLIESAKKTIKIVVFDWRWYPDDPQSAVQLFNQAIVRAVRRGVDVQVITNSFNIITILNRVGCRAKHLSSKNLVHAKMIIFDDQDVVLGSHNFSQYAFTMNFEVSIHISGVDEIVDFVNFYNSLYV